MGTTRCGTGNVCPSNAELRTLAIRLGVDGLNLERLPLLGNFVRLEPYEEAIKEEVRRALDCDAERLYGAGFASALARPPTSAFVAEGSAVAVGPRGLVD